MPHPVEPVTRLSNILMASSALRGRKTLSLRMRIGWLIVIVVCLLAQIMPMQVYAQEGARDHPAGVVAEDRVQDLNTPDSIDLVNAKIKVNTLKDEWSTDTATKAKSDCSLREALQATMINNPQGNQGCGIYPNDTKEFTLILPGGTYVLTHPDQLPNVVRKITIDGKESVTIDGGFMTNQRREGIFIVGSGGDLNLLNLTLRHGTRPFGGAIWMKAGVVYVEKVTFFKNLAENGPITGEGGAIRVDQGDLTVVKSVFSENGARERGGALSTGGTGAYISESQFLKNWSQGGGGAIASNAGGSQRLYISDSQFKENYVSVQYVAQPYDPTSDKNGGGAILNSGQMDVYRTEFYANQTVYAKGGGAILNTNGGDGKLIDVALSNNFANTSAAVTATYGAAIINEGTLTLIRTSVHGHGTHSGGAIFNRKSANLFLSNSTVSGNESHTYETAGVVNGTPALGSQGDGGNVFLYHSTLANNIHHEQKPVEDPLDYSAWGPAKLWMSNSIISSVCPGTGTIYSYGNNIFLGLCQRQAAEQGIDLNTDQSVDQRNQIGLDSLDYYGGPNLSAGFYANQLFPSSIAIDSANFSRCEHPLVGRIDQSGNKRGDGNDKCDIGAMEGKSSPSKLESTPDINSTILYPAVFINGGASSTQATLDLANTGSGVINFTAEVDESWDNTFTLDSKPSGALFKNQHALLNLTCTPTQKLGTYYGSLLIKTDLPDLPEVRYKLVCAAVSMQDQYMAAQQKPGPMSAGQSAPGEQTMVSAKFSNLGSKPVSAQPTWKNLGNNVFQFVAKKGAVMAADSIMDPNASIILNPNEVLTIDMICKPNGLGLFSNTLLIQTDDPVNPLLEYDISCEGVIPPATEKLTRRELYTVGLPGKAIEAIAISPDGRQVLAGHANDANVSIYPRNMDNGSISLQLPPLTQPGMNKIHDIKYSHNGKNVYYTSIDGNGIVVANRAADGALSVSQTITKSSIYLCGYVNNQFKFCPINAMTGAVALDVSPDDSKVYVAGQGDHTLTVFSRNLGNGSLTYTQSFSRTIGGQDVLGGANRVKVSRDGKNVYVLAKTDNTINVFSRGVNGYLALIRSYKDETEGLHMLDAPADLVESPDGKFLYVTSPTDNAVTVFRRAKGSGELNLVEVMVNVPGAYGITISHDVDGVRVLVALRSGDEIRVYRRDAVSGKLTFVESHKHGQGSLAIDGPVRLVSSSNDQDVYISLVDSPGVLRMSSLKLAPLAFNLSPASALAGSADFILTVNGDRFYPNSVVLWNGAALATSFVNTQRLNAFVPAAKVSSAGTATVKVQTPVPGGGDSSEQTFTITAANQAPLPSIQSISPNAAISSVDPVNVVINGANFTPQSRVYLNGKAVDTTYINPAMLLVQLVATDLGEPGPLAFTVVNVTSVVAQSAARLDPQATLPTAEMSDEEVNQQAEQQLAQEAALAAADLSQVDATQISKPLKFTTMAAGKPATPAISKLVPGSAPAGSATFTLMIEGYNFSANPKHMSVLLWNGQKRNTTVLDSRRLLAELTAADLATQGSGQVAIFTPGRGESEVALFVIHKAGDNPKPFLDSHYISRVDSQWVLTLSGVDFKSGAKIRLNGSERATAVLNSYQATAVLSEADLTGGGLLRLDNPAPGGGASNSIPLAPRKNQSISFGQIGDKSIVIKSFSLNATATSGLTVSFSSTTQQICTVSGNVVTMLTPGLCKIVASQAGDPEFDPAPIVQRSFNVIPGIPLYLPLVRR
jgi:CSLREA domain-containing protein